MELRKAVIAAVIVLVALIAIGAALGSGTNDSQQESESPSVPDVPDIPDEPETPIVPDNPPEVVDPTNAPIEAIGKYATACIVNYYNEEAKPYFPGFIHNFSTGNVKVVSGNEDDGWVSNVDVTATVTYPDGSRFIEIYHMEIQSERNGQDYTHYNTDHTVTKNTVKATHTATSGERRALQSAKLYLSISGFSYKGLYNQLMFDGYSEHDAAYGAFFTGADWNEQAVRSAKAYLSIMPMSQKELYNQLLFDGYTPKCSEYAVGKVY